MSVYYNVYLDGMVKGKRVNLLPQILHIGRGESVDYFKADCLYWGQSTLHEAYDEICERGTCGIDLDTLPQSIREQIVSPKYNWTEKELEQKRRCVAFIPFDTLAGLCENGYEYSGWITKRQKFDFEHDEIDEMEPIDEKLIAKMTPEKMRGLVYYEWDNYYGPWYHIRRIVERASVAINWFNDANVGREAQDVRVIIDVS